MLFYWKKDLLFLHFKLACLHRSIYRDGEHWGLGPVQIGCVPASCPVTAGMDSVRNRNKMEYGRTVDDLWRKRQFNVLIQSPLLIWKWVNWISSSKRLLQPTGGDPWYLHTVLVWTVNPAEVLHTVPVTEENLSVSPVLCYFQIHAHIFVISA